MSRPTIRRLRCAGSSASGVTESPDTPLRVGLLSNPASGGNRRTMGQGLGAIRAVLDDYPHTVHREVQNPHEIATALAELAAGEFDVVAINGGDGTVQCALTTLMCGSPFAKPPLLALLRAGTTSMTAGDVGLAGTPARALRRLLAHAARPTRATEVRRRQVLKVQAGVDGDPRCGMFFGAGAIVRGIELFHRRLEGRAPRGELGPGLAIARLLFAILRRDTDYAPPLSVGIGLNGDAPEWRHCSALLVSTLDRLFFGLRPFWDVEPGGLRFTALASEPRHALRVLPALLRGRRHRLGTRGNGYQSQPVSELRLCMRARYTIDGEIFEADERAPLRVSAAGVASFLTI